MDKIKIVYANTMDYTFSLQQRPHHIMNSLSKMGYDVHWINSKNEKGKRPDRFENLTIWYDWDIFVKRNPECDVYFSSWSKSHKDLKDIKAKIVAYDSLDNFEENETEEVNMVNASDVVFTTSKPLFDLRKTQHENVHMCRNGCWYGFKDVDLGEFKNENIQGDYLLFSGAIADWVDVDLLNKISEIYQVIVVGAYFGLGKELGGKIKFLGTKNYLSLQNYYKNALVNLVPFKRCQTSDYSNPIKMYESSVYGVPTVSIDIPEAIIHNEAIYVAHNHNDFIRQIERAIKQKNDEKRKEILLNFAKENDWMERVNLIDREVRKLLVDG